MAKTVKVKLKARQWVHGGPAQKVRSSSCPNWNLETTASRLAEVFGEIVGRSR
jgi:hypothetical protein